MYLLALWSKDCSDDSYTYSKYNRDCDVTICLTVRAAKLRKRGNVEVLYIITTGIGIKLGGLIIMG